MNKKLDATDDELKQGKKLLKSIDSWWGMLRNKFAGWKYKATEVEGENGKEGAKEVAKDSKGKELVKEWEQKQQLKQQMYK